MSKSNQMSFCYWSIGNGAYSFLLNSLVRSARKTGVTEDIHVWSDRKISGAITHFLKPEEARDISYQSPYLCDFKYRFQMKMLNYPYDAYIYLDSDIIFINKPTDILALLGQDPIHVFLEGCITNNSDLRHSEWYGVPMNFMVSQLRTMGVQSSRIFGLNGGFWIIRNNRVEEFCELANHFYKKMYQLGYRDVNDEPPLCYAAHMLSEPEHHLLKNSLEVYGNYNCKEAKLKLPSQHPWLMEYWFTNEEYKVHPSIVHCFRSKKLLLKGALTPAEKISYQLVALRKK